MNYNTAIAYINSFINFEKIPRYQYAASFKPERIRAVLDGLGNPHKDLNVIHVAGSKGKGSTCAIAAYILKEAGYKVGLYTSPHLINFKERIRILDGSRLNTGDAREFEGTINNKEFIELVEKIKPIAEKFREHKTLDRVSFFEIITACAFLYFKKKQVDVAVLETGLGGRLDATNVIIPLVCGITNISLEHTDKLGDTLAEIAYEKAGIIKDERRESRGQSLVISSRQEKEAIKVIRRVCRKRDAKLYEVGKDIKYSILNSSELGQVFDLEGPGYRYKNLELNLIGAHQIENASLSIGMLKAINKKKFYIKEDAIKGGLKKVDWPGRLQIIQRNPYIVLDGAQNPASMLTLASSVKKIFKYEKLISIFGISSDKNIRGVSNILRAFSDIIILTKASNNPRATDIPRLKSYFQNSRPCIEKSRDINEAVQKALKLANKEDLILITGSLFVVGDVMKCLKTV
ncbi:MAG: bifunctional folylpolyglutamate synthase/dihydrofolate synthase [Candidatus Omnitrophica bacterium]|nr:bifunctional folylpolyglutamate synthase/dihydrofolate synthase [Candidatus Omnitrophota bacterium]